MITLNRNTLHCAMNVHNNCNSIYQKSSNVELVTKFPVQLWEISWATTSASDRSPACTHTQTYTQRLRESLSLSLTHTHIQPQPIPHTDTICYIPNNPVLDTVHSNPYHPKLSTCTLQLHLYSVLLLMQSPHRLCFPTREFFMGSFSCSSWGKHNETGSCYLANSF